MVHAHALNWLIYTRLLNNKKNRTIYIKNIDIVACILNIRQSEWQINFTMCDYCHTMDIIVCTCEINVVFKPDMCISINYIKFSMVQLLLQVLKMF